MRRRKGIKKKFLPFPFETLIFFFLEDCLKKAFLKKRCFDCMVVGVRGGPPVHLFIVPRVDCLTERGAVVCIQVTCLLSCI